MHFWRHSLYLMSCIEIWASLDSAWWVPYVTLCTDTKKLVHLGLPGYFSLTLSTNSKLLRDWSLFRITCSGGALLKYCHNDELIPKLFPCQETVHWVHMTRVVSYFTITVGNRLTNSSDNEHFREGFLCSDNEHSWAYYAARKIA
jgi:hypothetical protein